MEGSIVDLEMHASQSRAAEVIGSAVGKASAKLLSAVARLDGVRSTEKEEPTRKDLIVLPIQLCRMPSFLCAPSSCAVVRSVQMGRQCKTVYQSIHQRFAGRMLPETVPLWSRDDLKDLGATKTRKAALRRLLGGAGPINSIGSILPAKEQINASIRWSNLDDDNFNIIN